MGAVLPGDAGDEGHLVGPPNHYCLRARPRGKFVCIQNSLARRGSGQEPHERPELPLVGSGTNWNCAGKRFSR
jgi:hypothetical protein